MRYSKKRYMSANAINAKLKSLPFFEAMTRCYNHPRAHHVQHLSLITRACDPIRSHLIATSLPHPHETCCMEHGKICLTQENMKMKATTKNKWFNKWSIWDKKDAGIPHLFCLLAKVIVHRISGLSLLQNIYSHHTNTQYSYIGL